MTEIFLYDTYALIEILNRNSNYEKYVDADVIINDFIFAEFSYQLLVGGVVDGDDYLDELEQAIARPDVGVIKKAMKFRYKNKKKKMSMTDCISYIMSLEFGVKFLTGDKEFEGLDNVEFVK